MRVATRILQVIEFLLLPFLIFISMFSLMGYDSPITTFGGGLGIFYISTMPIVVDIFLILSIIKSKPEQYRLSFWLSLIPILLYVLPVLIWSVLSMLF